MVMQLVLLDERTDSRIDRCAALLDEKIPGWQDYVNFDRLDMGSSRWSIEGQIGRHKFGIPDPYKASHHVLSLLGLSEENDVAHALQTDEYELYSELTYAWKCRYANRKETNAHAA